MEIVPPIDFLISQGMDPDDTTWDKTIRVVLCGTDAELAQHLQDGQDLTKIYGHAERSPCEVAVQRDVVTKLQLLFDAGADPMRTKPDPPYEGKGLLHVAAEYGSVRCLQLLLTLGLPVNQAAGLGTTPLMEACEHGQLEAVRLLLAAGSRVDLQNEFHATALNTLTEYSWTKPADNLEILKLLHQYGANLDHVDNLGTGIVQTVAEEGYSEALRWLVDQGADLNLNHYGETALHRAVIRDHLDCMEILLQGGANPNALLEDDETVLFQVQSGASVRLLLKYGADPTVKPIMFDCTPTEFTRDPIIKAAFSETPISS